MRFLVLAALMLVSPGAAPPAAPSRTVLVRLSSFDFTPASLHLRAGAPILLRLENGSGGGHNFSAPQFFAAARIEPTDAGLVRRGTVEVPSHSVREIRLVPAAGRYRLRCTHSLHTAFGMKGSILVD